MLKKSIHFLYFGEGRVFAECDPQHSGNEETEQGPGHEWKPNHFINLHLVGI